jgi:hypothetical protein
MKPTPKIMICYSFKDQEMASEIGFDVLQKFEFDIEEMPEADVLFKNLTEAGGNVSYWVANRFIKGYSENYFWN